MAPVCGAERLSSLKYIPFLLTLRHSIHLFTLTGASVAVVSNQFYEDYR